MSTSEGETVFTGSISNLGGKKRAPHPAYQFCINAEPHWMFVFLMSQLLFWTKGFESCVASGDYCYTDNHYDHHGGIPSGPNGSGVFIISLLLMVLCCLVLIAKIVVFKPEV
ncbi:hypothetical protein M885DRAFT_499290 [Pelagophyceae sp. CCMP2097]|nr:hypothetical protein M885DRAFT_499290 [Pelagophyceae sp. CCMP2097]|mmetsp:Transcript_29881/g.100669  ORF Transcript_29881/g.100669 Transcript_29881/m.100669 type:complete len:112 (+) Transcript_29881:42-377(+)